MPNAAPVADFEVSSGSQERLPPLRIERGGQWSAPMTAPEIPPYTTWNLTVSESAEQKFRRLADQWRRETAFSSSVSERTHNKNYQHIIGMGRDAVPILLAELERDPDDWFMALHYITEAQPVSDDDAGQLDAMAKSWIRWGHDHGYR
jgi:hypothetical protein